MPKEVSLTISAPLERGELPELFERTCALLEGSPVEVLCCEVAGVDADAVAIDALARLALAARRCGCQARLCGASAELLELVAFLGLSEVLRECSQQTADLPVAPTPPAAGAGRTAGRSSRLRGRT